MSSNSVRSSLPARSIFKVILVAVVTQVYRAGGGHEGEYEGAQPHPSGPFEAPHGFRPGSGWAELRLGAI